MIVGIATASNYRNREYITKCLLKIALELLTEGKSLCLFFDNPNAGRIYHKLGFKNIENWTMISK